jgi:hypothetical protein
MVGGEGDREADNIIISGGGGGGDRVVVVIVVVFVSRDGKREQCGVDAIKSWYKWAGGGNDANATSVIDSLCRRLGNAGGTEEDRNDEHSLNGYRVSVVA